MWKHFVEMLKGMGYAGSEDSLDEVRAWLKSNGHDPEKVELQDGSQDIAKMFYEREGRPLNAAKAAEAASEEQRINAAVQKRLDDIGAATGFKTIKGTPVNPHRHDVSVKAMVEEDPTGGYGERGVGDFFVDVAKACQENGIVSQRLDEWNKAAPSTYANEGTGADGGFLVPPDFRATLTSKVLGEESLLSRTDQYPLAGNSISFPDDEATPWGSSGIQGYWVGEATAITQSKPDLKLKTARLRKVAALVPVTEELLEDANAMATYVSRKGGEVLDWKVADAIVNGTGSTQPLGLLNAPSTISVAKVTSQDSTTFVFQNAVDMYSRLYAPYMNDAIWLMNQDVLAQIITMSQPGKDITGTAVSEWGVSFIPPGRLADAPFGSILGRPIVPHQACATLGTVGDVIFTSLSRYMTAVKSGGVETATSMHLYFDADAVAFKIRLRVDGQPWLSSAISAANGSNTYSSAVTVATRS